MTSLRKQEGMDGQWVATVDRLFLYPANSRQLLPFQAAQKPSRRYSALSSETCLVSGSTQPRSLPSDSAPLSRDYFRELHNDVIHVHRPPRGLKNVGYVLQQFRGFCPAASNHRCRFRTIQTSRSILPAQLLCNRDPLPQRIRSF